MYVSFLYVDPRDPLPSPFHCRDVAIDRSFCSFYVYYQLFPLCLYMCLAPLITLDGAVWEWEMEDPEKHDRITTTVERGARGGSF